MEPLKPETKQQILANNPQAAPEDLEEYERLLADARVEIEQERQRARDEVMEDVGALVLRAAEQVIGGALDAERHRSLVNDAIVAAQASAPGGSGVSGNGGR